MSWEGDGEQLFVGSECIDLIQNWEKLKYEDVTLIASMEADVKEFHVMRVVGPLLRQCATKTMVISTLTNEEL